MKITGTDVIVEGRGTGGLTVEYVLEGGFVVSVKVPADAEGYTRTNAVREVKRLLERLVQTGALPKEMVDGENQDGQASTMAASPNSPRDRAGRSDQGE
ncbi:MAG TPA: hypothetical protein VGO22_06510 [Pseudorhizobium sp.]|jgi:hypothetical protein|nr:hypothetical protein [Pseudorhizobium sp.]